MGWTMVALTVLHSTQDDKVDLGPLRVISPGHKTRMNNW